MQLLRTPSFLPFLIAILPILIFAQGATNQYEYRLRCLAPNPAADPYRRKFGCKDVHFDTRETLFDDWRDGVTRLVEGWR